MPLILTANSHEDITNASTRPTSRFEYFSDFDDGDFSILDSRSLRRRQRFNRRTLLQPLLQRHASQYTEEQDSEEEEEEDEDEDDEDSFIMTASSNNDASNNSQDDDTIAESFSRSRVDIYRLAIRTNSEILEDLAAIIRILRQINALYRVFNSSSSNNLGGFLRLRRAGRSRLYSSDTSDEDQYQEEHEEAEEEEEEANKLLEAGLEDLQAVLSTDSSNNKKQSTLALLALITFQYSHCSDDYLKRYLDPNGEFNPTLAMFAAATYDDDDDDQDLKSCRDIMLAAEEIYGPDWLKEFHKGKEGALRKMLEKLTFVAKIRLKVRDLNMPPVIR
ncbi:hypothetical protein V8B55DRAFT_1106253 [Mucor lusitanicus]|uniref:Uncharacterized protein n=1 Tax=Mucor lusitanicus CBS 277.49 TaxID=747725 RepID=A0A168KSG6_MUCCL|nr:hypothetical protein MUCCIDRAFT_109541 [Mucor lusitanicus CBS 277.49]